MLTDAIMFMRLWESKMDHSAVLGWDIGIPERKLRSGDSVRENRTTQAALFPPAPKGNVGGPILWAAFRAPILGLDEEARKELQKASLVGAFEHPGDQNMSFAASSDSLSDHHALLLDFFSVYRSRRSKFQEVVHWQSMPRMPM